MQQVKVKIENIDGKIVMMFEDGDYLEVHQPIHEFIFQVAVEAYKWDGEEMTILLPESQSDDSLPAFGD